ncbi:rna-directed dna polymerase from mobile element jockey-like [Limosa lapponica baueri]|uniref:Rna-directed dna polymerase from mobile element jockey-like n=1 Tax=Limosa lapponica baueri TaxID=1758121 RepID=A0A2I0TSQ5_LIMLA|nr:rna-directed dna polymerase from mobile element jockey-like [Limosa lapponica baueri]
MDEQGGSGKTWTEEGSLQKVEKGTGHLEYRNVVRLCRDATRKARDPLEFNLARDVKDNKKGFFKYISSKRKIRENVGPLLNKVGALVMEDAEKAQLLNAFFASVFTAKAGPQESQTLEVRERAWR